MISFKKKHRFVSYADLKEKVFSKIEDRKIFLHSIRKVRNRASEDRFKVQLCFYQRIQKPDKSLLAIFNEGDIRFDGTMIPAWMVAEPTYIAKHFDVTVDQMAALEIFSATAIPMAAQERNKHFLWMGLESVAINHVPMNIQVFEYTENERYIHDPMLTPKVNPKTGEIVMHGGRPVYRVVTIVRGPAKHRFLESDTLADRASFPEPKAKAKKKAKAGGNE